MADVYCGAEPCPLILNATCVFYRGQDLLYLGVNTNDNLQIVIEKINQAFQNTGIGYAFNNGVVQTAPNQPVQLGGSLIQNTTIGGNFTLTFVGNVQAARHITTGGTASQFVKGDGTLDITQYQPIGNYLTGLSGDGTASGPGVGTLTLANVNLAPGTFGNGSTIPIITVNGKGLVTNITPTPIVIPPQPIAFTGDVVGSGFTGTAITLLLQNVNSNIYNTNTFLKFAVNAKGLVRSASPVTQSDINSLYGYTVGDLLSTSSYANPSWLTSLAWSKITGRPTTLSGYGITDALDTSATPQTKSGSLTASNFIRPGGTSSQFLKANGSIDSTVYAPLNNPIFTGSVTLPGTPVNPLEAATKQYVDDLSEGLHIHPACVTATTANLVAIYNNGASGVGATLTNNDTQAPIVIDGVTLALNNRVLIKNQTSQLQNGIYVVSNLGSVSTNWVLTRSGDFNQSPEINGGDFVFVTGGLSNDNTGWVQIETGVTVGVSNISFTQFSGAGTYQSGNGLLLTGNIFSINTSITADLSSPQTLINKTITGSFTGNLSGNASTVTDGVYTTGSYSDPSWITGLAWTKILSTPTTLSGYGITDAYTQTQINNFFSGTSPISGYNNVDWNSAYNDKINSAAVTGTTTKTLTLTQQDGGTIVATWTDINTDAVTSVFGRTGAILAQSGDYNTSQVTENTNLYFTEPRVLSTLLSGYTVGTNTALVATDNILQAFQKVQGQLNAKQDTISLTTTGSSGASTLVGSTLNIPNYTLSGLGGIDLNSPLTGFAVGANTSILATDSILQAFNKTQGQINARVSGTGTAGQVAFWSGATAQTGSNNLFWDSVNGRLGIGTNQPRSVLEVWHNATVNAVSVINTSILGASSGGGIALRTNAHPTAADQRVGGCFFGSVVGGVEYSPSAIFAFSSESWSVSRGSYLSFETTPIGGINRNSNLRILANGNVIIQNGGTFTDAGFRLDVNGTARVQGSLTVTTDATINGVNIGLGGGGITSNTRVGNGAGNSNTTGSQNTFIGLSAGVLNTTGSNNTFVGRFAGWATVDGSNNTFVGRNAGTTNISGAGNAFFGMNAGNANTASDNSFFGVQAGINNSTGNNNSFLGAYCSQNNTTGSGNSSYGSFAGFNQTTGSDNTFIGRIAGQFIANGSTALTIANNSTFLGARARANADNETNQIVIGHTAIGLGSNTTVIGNTSTTHGRWFGNLLIGTSTNVATSALTVESTTRGFLPPRMTAAQRNAIASPATGLQIFNITTTKTETFDGTTWQAHW